ncbi:tetratricopeptide repeat protein [Treponema sp. R80B11-R83G3]
MFAFVFIMLVSGADISAEPLPKWYLPLRDAIYEQELAANEIFPLYKITSEKAKTSLSGASLYVMLSRCEYMMGRAYQYEEKKDKAAVCYAEGIKWAQKALEIQAGAEAYQMLAEHISQSCAVNSTSYAMANGLNVEKYSKKALEIDKKNAAARIMLAARWVYPPWPLYDYKKGVEMMTVIPQECNYEKDDLFNVYIAIGYAYVQQKKFSLAKPWLLKCLEVYPTNKFAQTLLAKT